MAMKKSGMMANYFDYGTMGHICDPVLGVIPREEFMCPECKNTGEDEDGCPLPISRKEEHEKFKCPFRVVTCAACDKKMKVDQRKRHIKECTGPIVACNKCGAKVRKCYLESHSSKCMPFGQVGSLHLRLDQSCVVTEYMPDGAADKGGIRKGDLIVKIKNPDGEFTIASREDFMKAVSPQHHVFEGVELTVYVLRDPEKIQAFLGSIKSHTATALRRHSSAVSLKDCIPLKVTVGEETVAARDNRRKKLQAYSRAFPKLDYDVLDKVMTDPKACRQLMLEAFIEVDDDGSGAVDPREMHNVFAKVAEKLGTEAPSLEQCRDVFKEVDIDGNGLINFNEFFPYLRALTLDVVWAEGCMTSCPRCGLRTRLRNQERHLKKCCGDFYYRGKVHFDISDKAPLKVNRLGPASSAAGVRVGDILQKVNGKEVTSRVAVAKACSPQNGMLVGRVAKFEVKKANGEVDEIEMVIPPMEEPAVERVVKAYADHHRETSKKNYHIDWLGKLVKDPAACREEIRKEFADSEASGGFYTKEEHREVVRVASRMAGFVSPTDSLCDKLFMEVDPDGHGTVTINEIFPFLRFHFLSTFEEGSMSFLLDIFPHEDDEY